MVRRALTGLALLTAACLAHAEAPPARRAKPPPPSIYGPPVLVGAPRLHRHGRCDHPSRWHDGRRVFWYMGGWEFVDQDGKLYRYEARGPAGPRVGKP